MLGHKQCLVIYLFTTLPFLLKLNCIHFYFEGEPACYLGKAIALQNQVT